MRKGFLKKILSKILINLIEMIKYRTDIVKILEWRGIGTRGRYYYPSVVIKEITSSNSNS